MSYQSFTFFLFVAATLLLYYIVPGKLQKYILLIANIFFYIASDITYLPFLLTTLVVSWGGGAIMGKFYEKEKLALKECSVPAEKKAVRAKFKKRSKAILVCSLVVIVGLLVVCKYTKFFLKNVSKFVDVGDYDALRFIVPLGISFYTFMAIGYMLDVFWKRYSYEKNFISYAAFLTYFPHIVQGPIDRYNHFGSQLPKDKKIKYDASNIVSGFQLVIWGLFKKLVIADRLNVFVGSVYDNYDDYTGIILALATIVYSIQIYTDFSGCIDIVSGVSEMFGIKLAKNFNHPYFSRSIPEFWRRWHISLGDWFTDYIYYPASMCKPIKNIKKKCKNKKISDIITSSFPILVVWMITGIWHGAAWNYVAWGMYYAAIMVAGVVFADACDWCNKKLRIDTESISWKFWQMVRTFTLCTIGRVFFRAPRLKVSLSIFERMFLEEGYEFVVGDAFFNYGLDRKNIEIAVIAIIVLLVVDILQEKMSLREKINSQGFVFRWLLLLLGVFAVIIYGMYGPGYDAGSFIYEQF